MPADLAAKIAGLRNTLNLAQARRATARDASARLGYIGGQGDANLGDEAMLEAACGLLAGKAIVPLGFPRQEQRLAKIGLSGSRYFRSVILGGGTLINEYVWAQQVRTALQQGTPVWSLGTGVGSCGFGHPDQANLKDWKPMLADFSAIGVRGPRSQRALEAIGVNKVQVVGDLALSLCREYLGPAPTGRRFALNVTMPPQRTGDKGDYSALDELKPVLCDLVQEGWNVAPVAMHRDDVAPLQQFVKGLLGENVTVPVLSTAEEFFRTVRGCRFTIAVRLHASVLSCCAGVPPLMLGYRDKCLDFMESMDLADWHVSLTDAEPGEITAKARLLEGKCGEMSEPVWNRARHWQATLRKYVEAVPC